MLMSARRQAITDVIKTEYRGTAERSVTCGFTIRPKSLIRGLVLEEQFTWLHNRQPGIPRSLAKDQNWRDVDANMPTDVVAPMVVTIEPITAVPAMDPVASKKIARKGYPVGDSRADPRSPLQNSMAINMPKPKDPLIKTLSMIEVGTATAAFVISSDI